MRLYAVADVHGHAAVLRRLLEAIATDADSEPSRVYFLGNYCDRGPDTKEVLDILINGPQDWAPEMEWFFCRGPHDQYVIDYVLRPPGGWPLEWITDGGLSTLYSLDLVHYSSGALQPFIWNSEALIKAEKYVDFLETCTEVCLSDHTHTFSNSGITWDKPLNQQECTYYPDPTRGVEKALKEHPPCLVTANNERDRVLITRAGPRTIIQLGTGVHLRDGSLTAAVWERSGDIMPKQFLSVHTDTPKISVTTPPKKIS